MFLCHWNWLLVISIAQFQTSTRDKINHPWFPSSLIFQKHRIKPSKSQWSWRNFQNPGLSTGYKSPTFDSAIELEHQNFPLVWNSKNRINLFHKANPGKKKFFKKSSGLSKTKKVTKKQFLAIFELKKFTFHLTWCEIEVAKSASFSLLQQKTFFRPKLWA